MIILTADPSNKMKRSIQLFAISLGLGYSFLPHQAHFSRPARPGGVSTFRGNIILNEAAKDNRDAEVGRSTALEEKCWNPKLRRAMGTIASIGALETAYLAFNKLAGTTPELCGTDGDCSSVLTGPYSVVPGTEIPISAIGFLAYTTVILLSFGPVLQNQTDDDDNRILLTALTSTMAVFSVFLMTLLFGVLKQSCPFCILSAVLSISLAKLSWLGGALPEKRSKDGVFASVAGGLTAFVAATVLFVNNDLPSNFNYAGELLDASTSSSSTASLLASGQQRGQAPPPISTTSSSRALELAQELQQQDTRFFGAFWCSHCFDQKEALGKEAMAKIPYIECSRDGLDSQTALCKEKDVPGYPTWEINGKLYPGERDLDELEKIVRQARN